MFILLTYYNYSNYFRSTGPNKVLFLKFSSHTRNIIMYNYLFISNVLIKESLSGSMMLDDTLNYRLFGRSV